MNLKSLILSIILVISLSGCFQSKTTLSLNSDGSGKITESHRTLKGTPEILNGLLESSLKEMISDSNFSLPYLPLDSNSLESHKIDFKKLNKSFLNSKKFGNAKLVSIYEKSIGEFDAIELIYSFKDISKLEFSTDNSFLSNKSENSDLNFKPKKKNKDYYAINFDTKNKTLKVDMNIPPEFKEQIKGSKIKESTPSQSDTSKVKPAQDTQNAFAKQMMMMMFKNMKISFELEIPKGIKSTNANFVKENVITLFELDFEKLLENENFLNNMENPEALMENPKESFSQLLGKKGFIFESNSPLEVNLK